MLQIYLINNTKKQQTFTTHRHSGHSERKSMCHIALPSIHILIDRHWLGIIFFSVFMNIMTMMRNAKKKCIIKQQ